MPEQTVVPAQAGTQTTATGPVTDSAAVEAQADDRVVKLEQTVSLLQKTINGLAAAQRVQAKQAPVVQEPEQNLTLRTLKAELDARDTKLRDKAIRTEIDAYLRDSGVPEASRPILKAYIREQHGNSLMVDENDQVIYTDEFGEKKPFSELGKMILSTPGGQTFSPPVATPGAVGSRTRNGATQVAGGVKPIQEWTAEDYQKNPEAGLAQLRAAYKQSQGM